MRKLVPALICAVLVCQAAEKKVLFPEGARPLGPYSPGIQIGDTVYVSGQGGRDQRANKEAEGFDGQFRQTVENIRAVLKVAGMDLANVAYCQLYLDNMANYETSRRLIGETFQADAPAFAVLGITATPAAGAHLEMTCVATSSPKKAVWPAGVSKKGQPYPPGMLVADRLYLSGQGPENIKTGKRPAAWGEQVRQALDNIGAVLKAAGLDYPNMVFVNPYLVGTEGAEEFNKVYATFFEFGNTPGRATIYAASLPRGSRIEFTGVALRELSRRKAVRPSNMPPSPTASPCVFVGDTLYCSAKSGFVPGDGIQVADLEGQLKQTMRNLQDGLEEAGLGWGDVAATNIYLDDIADFAKLNALYGSYFHGSPPSRTTLQQAPSLGEKRTAGGPGRYPTLEQISLIAVRPH